MGKTIKGFRFNSYSWGEDYILYVEIHDDGVHIKAKESWFDFNLEIKEKDLVEKLTKDLTNLHVENWETEYDINGTTVDGHTIFVTDLEKWRLTFKYSTNETLRLSGYGMYPENWEDFEKIMNDLFSREIFKKMLHDCTCNN